MLTATTKEENTDAISSLGSTTGMEIKEDNVNEETEEEFPEEETPVRSIFCNPPNSS